MAGLTLYRGLTGVGGPLINLYLRRRLNSGKEDPERFAERLLQEHRILIGPDGPRTLRAVTHYWIDDDAIERVIRGAGGDVKAIHYPDRNHLFQPTETGLRSEYAKIEVTFDPAVLEDIVTWLEEVGMR